MEIIGLICEYNPFHNGHIYHIQEIKKMFPNSILILVINGYFLERGEISFLTKEDKVTCALNHGIDLAVELPVFFGTQSADMFAEAAIKILNYLKVTKIVFGSESNNIEILKEIAKKQESTDYQNNVKELLKKGLNYPTALAQALHLNFDFNRPNDLLAISYIKAIHKNQFPITPISIMRTNSYHDLKSTEKIISASNIRHKFLQKENITSYLPKEIIENIKVPNYKLYFELLKMKILTTPHLEQFLTVDEGIENRLRKAINISANLEEMIENIKTKRYTYNKIKRMFTHILLGITKEDNACATLDYIRILGFNDRGKNYLNQIKKNLTISTNINKHSIICKYELIASELFDMIQNTNTYAFELQNKPIYKE